MFKKIVSVALVLLAVVMLPTSVQAYTGWEPGELVPADKYAYTTSVSTGLEISSEGTATCRAKIVGVAGKTSRLECVMYLQKYSKGAWTNVAKWNESTTSLSLSISKTKTVNRGRYRVRTVFRAYKGNPFETITKLSAYVNY